MRQTFLITFTMIFGLALLTPQPVIAQTIQPSPHPLCDYEVLGPLEPGLIDRLGGSTEIFSIDHALPSLPAQEITVACLDSPGGSIKAGAELFRHFIDNNIATVIPPGWRCESACAIAFLGGSMTVGRVLVDQPSRQVYPTGRLGFHAPSLRLPEGSAFSGSEVASAFEAALAASDVVIRLSQIDHSDQSFLNGFLLRRILTTPPETIDYIDTVVEAAFAEVDVGAVSVPRDISIAQAEDACDLAVARFLGLERERGVSLPELSDMLKQLRQWRRGETLLHKSVDGRASPFPGQSHPTASVTGMPSAVKPFRTATRIWNSAT